MDKSGDVIAAKAIVSQGEENDWFICWCSWCSQNTDSLAESQSTNMGEEVPAFTCPNPKMSAKTFHQTHKFNTIEELELVLNGVVGQSTISRKSLDLFESKLGFTQMLSTVIILYTCGDIKRFVNTWPKSARGDDPPTWMSKSEDIYKISEVDGINRYGTKPTIRCWLKLANLTWIAWDKCMMRSTWARQNFLGHTWDRTKARHLCDCAAAVYNIIFRISFVRKVEKLVFDV